MAIRAVEWEVPTNDERSVFVRRERDDAVKVTWPCGEVRTFGREDAADAIAAVDLLSGSPDVWLELRDRNGYAIALVVRDGELYADTRIRDVENMRHVAWRDLRRAIRRAIRDKRDDDPQDAALEDPAPEPAPTTEPTPEPAGVA